MKYHTARSLFSDDPTAPGLLDAAGAPNPPTAVRRYLALGFSVIPLRGKVPVVTWREYQQRRPTRSELERWLRRGLFQNIGIVCGEVSGNLVVLDIDASGAYRAFRARFPNLARTYMVSTGGGGWHVYLRVDALPPSRRGAGMEIKANGHQVAAPPSIHPNGTPYRVAQPLDILHVPDLSAVVEWMRPRPEPARPVKKRKATSSPVDPALVAAIADHFRALGYRPNGDWLNGPCIYPERHSHRDAKRSFGFNVRTGYGWCFVCGSMLAKEIASRLQVNMAGWPVPPAESQNA
ncbi:MAG: bifunctional DNA primase/polymerase [Anaerolineae bacterium]|nr:bifunctional DNA primase/polymerase [Anaerolineae bacterium]